MQFYLPSRMGLVSLEMLCVLGSGLVLHCGEWGTADLCFPWPRKSSVWGDTLWLQLAVNVDGDVVWTVREYNFQESLFLYIYILNNCISLSSREEQCLTPLPSPQFFICPIELEEDRWSISKWKRAKLSFMCLFWTGTCGCKWNPTKFPSSPSLRRGGVSVLGHTSIVQLGQGQGHHREQFKHSAGTGALCSMEDLQEKLWS